MWVISFFWIAELVEILIGTLRSKQITSYELELISEVTVTYSDAFAGGFDFQTKQQTHHQKINFEGVYLSNENGHSSHNFQVMKIFFIIWMRFKTVFRCTTSMNDVLRFN